MVPDGNGNNFYVVNFIFIIVRNSVGSKDDLYMNGDISIMNYLKFNYRVLQCRLHFRKKWFKNIYKLIHKEKKKDLSAEVAYFCRRFDVNFFLIWANYMQI